MRQIKAIAVSAVLVATSTLSCHAQTGPQVAGTQAQDNGKRTRHVTGVVFHDANRNGAHDPNESGVAGVGVSNGSDIVQTDDAGRYKLTIGDNAIIL